MAFTAKTCHDLPGGPTMGLRQRQDLQWKVLGPAVLLVTAGNVYLTLQRGADRLWRDILELLVR